MDQPMPNLTFQAMTLLFNLRDFIRPPQDTLREASLRPGFRVLDFGCGPGGYTLLAARQVGDCGKVYALDLQPLAVKRVQAAAAKQGLTNIQTIRSDCATGLPDASLDVVLLYDIFHLFSAPDKILAELQRVLKPGGRLSFSDHHMQEDDLLTGMTRSGYFKLQYIGERTYTFLKSGRKTNDASTQPISGEYSRRAD